MIYFIGNFSILQLLATTIIQSKHDIQYVNVKIVLVCLFKLMIYVPVKNHGHVGTLNHFMDFKVQLITIIVLVYKFKKLIGRNDFSF